MPKEFQEDRRIGVTMTDQHGREYNAVLEKATMAPTGGIVPKFTAPVMPDQKYLFPVHGNHLKLIVWYDKWLEDLATDDAEWVGRLRKAAAKMYGQQTASAIKNPPPELLDFMGERPMDRRIVEAMRDGNRWILGLLGPDAEKPEWAKKLIPDPVAPVAQRESASRPWLDDVDGSAETETGDERIDGRTRGARAAAAAAGAQ